MFPLSHFLKFAAAGAIFTLTVAVHSPYAEEIIQILGPVGPHAPILGTVGDGRCNVHAVIWNADDMEAKSAAGVRASLDPGQTAFIDSSATETLKLKCGDYAETLEATNNDQEVAAK
jgi:hypothetical protein